MPVDFLCGAIEGFYGPPWSADERVELFDSMAAWGLNTYLYAPKDDLKHRARWREPYSPREVAELAGLIDACRERRLRFVYAISPGLDIRYSAASDVEALRSRLGQMHHAGCDHFAVLFDDIPGNLETTDLEQWGSLAAAQSHVANVVFAWSRAHLFRSRPAERGDARFVFCPTPYCGRMVAAGLGGTDYLQTIGRELHPEIDIFWTGPEIISREIPVEHVRGIHAAIRRKPLIWDNLHANDYDGRRCFCGPYSGRPLELRDEVAGILSNPNTEFPLNVVALHTLAAFVRARDGWDPRAAYFDAVREWLPKFASAGRSLSLEDVALFGDCYYLPFEEGPGAEAFCESARRLLTSDPSVWGDEAPAFRARAAQLKDLCLRLADLDDRPLVHALGRRLWELREELDVLDRYVASGGSLAIRRSGATRGGLVARLQRARFTPS